MTLKTHIEGIEKKFDEKFKQGVPSMRIHNEGSRESWIEHPDIKSFISNLLKEERQRIIETLNGLLAEGASTTTKDKCIPHSCDEYRFAIQESIFLINSLK